MRKTQIILGGLILLYGLLLLVGEVFHVQLEGVCWPVALILFGVFLIALPRLSANRPGFQLHIFPDIHRRGTWQVQPAEILFFVGDVDLDLTQAEIPAGETTIRLYGFVGDIDLRVPPEVGVQLAVAAFVNDARLWQQKETHLFSMLEKSSLNYAQAERKIRLEAYLFVCDLHLEQA